MNREDREWNREWNRECGLPHFYTTLIQNIDYTPAHSHLPGGNGDPYREGVHRNYLCVSLSLRGASLPGNRECFGGISRITFWMMLKKVIFPFPVTFPVHSRFVENIPGCWGYIPYLTGGSMSKRKLHTVFDIPGATSDAEEQQDKDSTHRRVSSVTPETKGDRGHDGFAKPDNESVLWSRLEQLAKKHSKQLAGTLNGFRHMGARLWLMDGGGLTIRPEPGEGWGEPSMCSFREDVDKWIIECGHEETLNDVLSELNYDLSE